MFHRGDADGDGALLLNDAFFVFNFLFLDEIGPRCLDAAEANGDLVLNISDGLFVLNFLFLGGPPPPYPSPGEPCGADGASGLGCLEYEGCATDESN
jgi:hypothetical protein